MRITPRATVLAGLGLAVAAVLLLLTAIASWSGGSSAGAGIQGDADCSGGVDAIDALWSLRAVADAQPLPGCADEAADVDCSGVIDEHDVTELLRFAAVGVQASPVEGCPAIGAPLPVASTPPTSPPFTETASPTPAATPEPTTPAVSEPPLDCSGPGGGPSLPVDPGGGGAPAANGYTTTPLLGAGYLGGAANSMIKFALIPGRPDEAVVALQSGLIFRVAMDGSFAPQPWGDVSGLVNFEGEEGLLSLAFSPDYEQDCRVYLYYTPGCGNPCRATVLARFLATPEGLLEETRETIIEIPDFAANHNGGDIAFDADGYLYLSLGDGGGGGDPGEDGQDLGELRGKVLRLDVSGDSGYVVPPANPFAGGQGGARPEIFAYGFRNPFRMSIDPVSGNVWLGDVGQNRVEEVDRVVAGGNYGWDCYEGSLEFESEGCGDPQDYVFPRAEYDHDFGASVIGGVVYRGDDLPELYGWYLYGDFYSGRVWAVDSGSDSSPPVQLLDSPYNISSFVLLPDGEVAIVTYGDGVLKLAD